MAAKEMRQLVLEFLDCKPGQPGARKKVLLSELEDDMKMNDIDSSAYQRAGGYDRLCSVIVELVQEGRLQPVKRAPGNGRVRIPQEVLTVFDIQYHIVWTTKYRYKVLQGNVAERLRILIRQGCEARNIQIVRASIGKEHVLLLISCPPMLAPSKIMQYLKGRSSKMLQDEFQDLKKRYWGQQLWAHGYFCRTVGTVTEEIIKEYIENQGHDRDDEGFKIEE